MKNDEPKKELRDSIPGTLRSEAEMDNHRSRNDEIWAILWYMIMADGKMKYW